MKFIQPDHIPSYYADLSEETVLKRLYDIMPDVKKHALIVAHNYQNDEIVQFADITGDSLELARKSIKSDKEMIIFCGVHFMAESADILNRGKKIVTLPNMEAGCALADMANIENLETAWNVLDGNNSQLVPVTYINSTAKIKAFCGRNGGLTCTSSNAYAVFIKYLEEGKRIFSLPDENLGTNTARELGLTREDIAVWNWHTGTLEGNPDARAIVWKGYCPVHTPFSVQDIERLRGKYPSIKIIVHPECIPPVAERADYVGSTSKIINTVRDGKPGDIWAIGTEINLVARLQQEHPEQTVLPLKNFTCACSTMSRIQPEYLLWNAESILKDTIVNRITVEPSIAKDALIALERMLAL